MSELILGLDGRPVPAAPPHGARIFHIQSRSIPEFRWEYHADKKILYVVYRALVGVSHETAEAIAHNVPDNDAAANYARCWIAGYRAAKLMLPRPEGG